MSDTRGGPAMFRGWRAWVLGFAFWTGNGLLRFAYFYLDVYVRGRSEPVHTKLIEELTGAWGTALLMPAVFLLARRIHRRGLPMLLHVPAVVAVSALHTTWNLVSRLAAFRLFGYGHYDYGIMRLRYVMEFPADLIGYVMMAAFILLFDQYRRSRDREVRLAELESEIASARLHSLEAQLQPHFLFNALHTVSSVMYDDVAQADRMIARLSDLLRRTLDQGMAGEVTLREELVTLGIYLDIIRARFGDRLTVSVDASGAPADARVPHLLLQPLVENAVKHAEPRPGAMTTVRVAARRTNGHLQLTVQDDGPGLAISEAQAFSRGIGLATTRRRLEKMYDGRAAIRLERPADGGLTVRVEIPLA